MRLRFREDRRAILWAFVLFPAAALVQYFHPFLVGWLVPLSLYTGFCSGVLAHQHNHCPVFLGRQANLAYGAWLSLFYGYPIFAWLPTHNANHHRFGNAPGDASITWRLSRRNTFWALASYCFVAARHQTPLTREFVQRSRAARGPMFRRIFLETAVVTAGHVSLLVLALALHGVPEGVAVYVAALVIPALSGLVGMMLINFIQHVDCDPWSRYDHSRNFVSPLGNYLVFNAGLHTAHHEQPGLHWSRLPELHRRLAPRIHPALLEASIFGFVVKTYLLGAVFARFRTRQIGRAAYDVPGAWSIEGSRLGRVR